MRSARWDSCLPGIFARTFWAQLYVQYDPTQGNAVPLQTSHLLQARLGRGV
jgi:hypothetical protein